MSISSTANTINSSSPCASTSPTSEPESESLNDAHLSLSHPVGKRHKSAVVSVPKPGTIIDDTESCDQTSRSSSMATNVPSTISKRPKQHEIEPRDIKAEHEDKRGTSSDRNSDEKHVNTDMGMKQTNPRPSSITKPTTAATTNTTITHSAKLSPSSTTRADLVVNSLSTTNQNHHHDHHQQKGQLNGSKTRPLLINNQTVANIASASSASLSSAKTLDHQGQKSCGPLSSQTNELKAIPIVSSQLIFSSFLTNNPATKQVSLTNCAGSSSDLNTNKTPLTIATPTIVTGTIAPTVNLTYGQQQATSVSLGSSCVGTVKQTIGHPRRHHQLTTGDIGVMQHSSGTNGGSAGNAAAAKLVDMGKKLLEATRHNQIEQVRQLVVNSGAPFTSDWLGTTALHLAAQNGCAEIAEILLKGGVNRDARTKLERTALHLAAQCGSAEVVDLLINHGADIDARDMLKMTPIHWAVERGHVGVIERLLIAGADVSLRNKFQLTPIDIARRSEYYEVVELFKNWSNSGPKSNDEILETLRNLENSSSGESHDMLDLDYQFALTDNGQSSDRNDDSMLNIDEPCIDLVELEWSNFDFEPDLFLPNDSEGEPKVEYLKKIVEELQKENRQLRQKVEQLSSPNQEM